MNLTIWMLSKRDSNPNDDCDYQDAAKS